jgi:hypothetical protein
MKSACITVLLAAAALMGCNGSQQAMGTANSIIVLAPDSVWAVIGDSVLSALEPPIFTVRDERTFEVTHISPQDPRWNELRRFRQVVTIGAAADGWVEPAVRRGAETTAPGVAQVRNVWARNQLVTAVVLPAGAGADVALAQVPQTAMLIDSTFRMQARQRMYTSRPNTELRDSLLQHEGFGLTLPNVYRQLTREDPQVHLFQNSTQIGGDLVRSVLVTWQDGLVELSPQAALAWREQIGAREYRPPQETQPGQTDGRMLDVDGVTAAEAQGIWDGTDATWPMSGPFITRMLHCPAQNRTYLLDGWLYSPGRPKYEYMIHLQTILNTFECG